MTKTDADLVKDTILDYFEGWFTADAERMERALHPDLVKRSTEKDQAVSLGIVTKPQMVEWTREGEGRKDAGPIDIRIHDINGNIATATVRGGVYHEYVHLVRGPEGWKIANALWRFAE